MTKLKIFILLLVALCLVGFDVPTSEYTADAYDTLLMHMNGTDASTTFPDSSTNNPKGNASVVGDAQVDTTQQKFGTGSCFYDKTGDALTYIDNADWDFGSGNFTIDLWIRYNTTIDYPIIAQWDYSGATDKAWWFWATNTTMYFRYTTDGSSAVTKSVATDPDMTTGVWYHLAVVRSGNSLYFYKDGTQQEGVQDVTGVTIYNGTQKLYIGALQNGAGIIECLDGWLDELRIGKGIARDWAPADIGDVIFIQYVKKYINNLNPNKIGTPMWSLKIKAECLWRNLAG